MNDKKNHLYIYKKSYTNSNTEKSLNFNLSIPLLAWQKIQANANFLINFQAPCQIAFT